MNRPLCGTQPILCAPVIRQVDQLLIELLHSLTPEEWELQTVAPKWCVRDVAAHLLDTALRKLSGGRDRCHVEKLDLRTHDDVVVLVNRLNREGVTVYRRLSPPLLTQLMQLACAETADFYESLDPFANAAIGVSWAGEQTSLVWFDNARELTERWHHQQQIRLATGREGIMAPHLYHPVIDTFLRGLPHTFRKVDAPPGTALLIEVAGDCGGRWCLLRCDDCHHLQNPWRFVVDLPSTIAAHVILPQSIAWRLFTKGIDRAAARSEITITGETALAEHILELTAIVG